MTGFAKAGLSCLAGVLIVGLIVLVSDGPGDERARLMYLCVLAVGSLGLLFVVVRRRNPRVKRVRRPPGPWSCGSCAAINPQEMHGCSACGEPRT